MTRDDIEHLAQVTHSLRSVLDEDNFDRLIDRMLWAIHSSPNTPEFSHGDFVSACIGRDGIRVFRNEENSNDPSTSP